MALPGTLTLGSLITQAQQRINLENSQQVVTSEWTTYLNNSYQELYDLLLQEYGDDYFTTNYTFVTDGVSDSFALPSDFLKLRRCEIVYDPPNNQNCLTLLPFNFQEENRYSVSWPPPYFNGQTARYHITGSGIRMKPRLSAGITIQLWYIPNVPLLVNASDIADVGPWSQYLIVDACIQAKDKLDQDTSVLMAQKAALKQRIEAAAANRDAGQPLTVTDANARGGWPWGW